MYMSACPPGHSLRFWKSRNRQFTSQWDRSEGKAAYRIAHQVLRMTLGGQELEGNKKAKCWEFDNS